MKTAIIFGSTTGNNEKIAEAICLTLKDKGVEADLKNAAVFPFKETLIYDILLLGSSTWGDGELQDDMIYFISNLKGSNLNGKKYATFGVGEDFWPNFCTAPQILEKEAKAMGADCFHESLRVNGQADSNMDQITSWAESIADAIKAL
ncbi:MAG: flavodoxin domain-containing protein [Candidatus Cloacimonetes bacterium]|nr:flavodoxin domain-containing protein [Candidatus Cloacimonadota bacterium]HPM03010.1 flavodoxin domain-containing protein [Candidatus Cloacimonadota bacterium]